MCGIVGIWGDVIRPRTQPKFQHAGQQCFLGLYSLQHRGQDGAGIASIHNSTCAFQLHRKKGLVSQIFTSEWAAEQRDTFAAVGHTRYATAGDPNDNSDPMLQPFLFHAADGQFAFCHNGHIVNADSVREAVLNAGHPLLSNSDSELIAHALLLDSNNTDWTSRITQFMRMSPGAYSCVVMTTTDMYGFRDHAGTRPLCLGHLASGAYVLASESAALSTLGASLVTEVAPGHVVRIYHDIDGSTRYTLTCAASMGAALIPKRPCVFEHVYLARPDSVIDGRQVHTTRERLGATLAAACAHIDASLSSDAIVIGVPDSSTPMAMGYARAAGRVFTAGMVKNRYIGRTFIQPTQHGRRAMVQLKYNPLMQNVHGKQVILVDDSIVRGTTMRALVGLLKDAGATQVHVRVPSAPVINKCTLGVNLRTRGELLVDESVYDSDGSPTNIVVAPDVAAKLGADSLVYLSRDAMERAVGQAAEIQFCTGCFGGTYACMPDIEDLRH